MRNATSKMVSALLLASMLGAFGCGGDDDETNVNVQTPEQQREEGTVPTGPSVIINQNIDLDARIMNKQFFVQNNNLNMRFNCRNLDPVVHPQVIYVAVNCNQIVNSDINGDGIVDQTEVEQQTGAPIASLPDANGSDFQQNLSVPLNSLPANEEQFALVVFGAVEGVNIPIICNSFNVQTVSGGTTGGTTTGTTTTGTTTGTTGTTTGTNGTTTTGTNGTTTTGTNGTTTSGTNGATTTGTNGTTTTGTTGTTTTGTTGVIWN